MMTLNLDPRDEQALAALIDMALRGSGLAAHEPSGLIMRRISEAKQAADKVAEAPAVG